MGIRIIRAGGWLSIRTDAGTIEPGFDIATLPDSRAGTFGVALSAGISAFRVLRPIQRETLAHKPFAEIGAADRTGRDGAAIWVEAEGRAVNRTPGNECIKIVCRLRATTILQTVLAAAQLAAFGRVDTPEPNARSMYFQRVAVNDAGLTHKIVGHAALDNSRTINTRARRLLMTLRTSDYRKLRGLNFGQFSSGFSEGRFSGRSG